MVNRLFVEKKEALAAEARALFSEARGMLVIKGLTRVRVVNRYDVEGADGELLEYAKRNIFSEPQLDTVTLAIETEGAAAVFGVEPLPGQFDQRADSAAQCIQLVSQGEKPVVRTAKFYVLYGDLTAEDVGKIKKFVINPVECREADTALPETLKTEYPAPHDVETLHGFIKMGEDELAAFVRKYGLAMDADDVRFCRDYFASEHRDPTLTEVRMIDTYWSDHCRHTTFLTTIDKAEFEDAEVQAAWEDYLAVREKLGRTEKPVNLMDIATIAAKMLRKEGKLENLDVSDEINACTVKIKVDVDGKDEDWLLLFKNETHNHPTEIEPFGGAATCIGGAIRDPLSGRAYVYSAMRVTGAGDPLTPIEETLPGKLPQKKIVTTAAAGYSSYGNQIGLATGIVDEIYHPGYVAKRLEIGAVTGAVPARNVVRETPAPGDVVILLGGRTGRDGCGGATGSSKAHSAESLSTCGAEVQKGNAPEERKLQRLFRNPEASLLIKRCNDFGAGGVSVAIGELADGLFIDLNAVPKKYEGLDGTELAISESQERMAVVVAPENAEKFRALANAENLEATVVAKVTEEPRLRMQWNGKIIVDISREFLSSNGAEKHATAKQVKAGSLRKDIPAGFAEGMKALVSELNVCSKRGLSERFDSTIGAGTVMMPFGGKNQLTPIQCMVNKVSVENGETDTCSLMSWGFNPFISEKSPFHGAYLAVIESVAKLVAAGASTREVYLTFQEYFEKPMGKAERWGKPLAALLGAYRAQRDLGMGAIGGKDSMSGTFEHIDVPPTLVSFAVTTEKCEEAVSPEFKRAGSEVRLVECAYGADGLPVAESFLQTAEKVHALMREGKVISAYTPAYGGVAEAVFKCALGNGFGFAFADGVTLEDVFGYKYGAFVIECAEGVTLGRQLGRVTEERAFVFGGESVTLSELSEAYENKLESVYSCNIKQGGGDIPKVSYTGGAAAKSGRKFASPKMLIPVFPGTNCEYDTAKAARRAGIDAEIFVINNLTPAAVAESADEFARKVREAEIVFIPGGFSGGDEPDGSGKFITSFFRGAKVTDAVRDLLKHRDGLMAGICNGFQALIKLGLVTVGDIVDADENAPTLTYNTIARHQSKIVRTRVCSDLSPWLTLKSVGDIVNVPISHGEGRFMASPEWLERLAKNGQIATQYVDLSGEPTYDIAFNPNGSDMAVEGITSPDGRVLGKMGHSERVDNGLYLNVPGDYDMALFRSAAAYFA